LNPARFRRRLLAWFDQSKRNLPWRCNRDPYRIWVSEVMLQQTTVAAVVPYFLQFLETFPNVKALAAADEQEVLHLWQGLGYYRRARNLHQAARMIVAAGGDLPNDPAVWAAMPGVGRYILGAVLSQAFDRPMPIVEANSLRVLCRLFGKRGDVKSSIMQRWLWQAAEELLPRKRTGDFNQAMMELGALVCTPDNPRCHQCPVRTDCSAYADGTQNKIPAKAASKRIEQVREVAVVVRRAGRVLLAQRAAAADRWPSMWEFPQTELLPGETHEKAAQRWARKSLGLRLTIGPEVATIRYVVTRFHIALTALESTPQGRVVTKGYQVSKWLHPKELGQFPASTAQRTLMAVVAQEIRQPRLY
jgi:A/G-specific adenine glycosylase